MKRGKRKYLSGKRLHLWQLKLAREKSKAKNRAKKKNTFPNAKIKIHQRSHTDRYSQFFPGQSKDYRPMLKLTVPEDFRFMDNYDSFTSTLNGFIDEFNSKFDSRKDVYIDLSSLKKIDNAGIIILLTLINYFNRLGKTVQGHAPNDEQTLRVLEDSDFFTFLKPNWKVHKKSKDKIAGFDVVNTDVIAPHVENVMQHLTGFKDKYMPLYNALGEIQLNSIEHANKDDATRKNWFMSFHYEDDKCIIMMADIGKGILGTLDLLLKQKVIALLKAQQDSETLYKLFKGDYQSSTLDPNRNTGLPGIFEDVSKKYLGKTYVISNKASVELSTGKTSDLNVNFPGTLYSIELSKDNIQKWNLQTL